MMRSFDFHIPTKIHFGTNIISEAIAKEKELLNDVIILVTDGRILSDLGYTDILKKAIIAVSSGRIVEFNNISPNPKLEEIKEGIRFGRSLDVSCIIGFGGGSAMDAAKAIAIGLGNEVGIETYLFDGIPPPSALPLILIPTTAGTGSELSQGAIITCTSRNVKAAIRGGNVYPRAAIVDPYFTLSVPRLVTMETGFDVIAHAVESYISTMATPLSEMLSEYAITTAVSALRILSKELKNIKAREQMSYASMLMGINLGNVGTALPHRLQYPIGARTDTSHAAGLVALYPAWIKNGYEYAADRWNHIGSLICGKACSCKKDVLEAFQVLFQELGLCYSLNSLGIERADINKLVNEVTGNIKNDPSFQHCDIIWIIYDDSL